MEKYYIQMPMHYRSKWYVLRGSERMMFAMGVFRQNLFIDRKNQVVIAKLSSHELPMDSKQVLLTMRGIEAIRRHLVASHA